MRSAPSRPVSHRFVAVALVLVAALVTMTAFAEEPGLGGPPWGGAGDEVTQGFTPGYDVETEDSLTEGDGLEEGEEAAGEATDDGTVTVGYYEYGSYQTGAREGEVRGGYAYEYLMKLAEYTGWRYTYVYGTRADLYQALIAGEVDLLAGIPAGADGTGMVNFPTQSMGREDYVLVRKATDATVTSDPETVAGKRIGTLSNSVQAQLEGWLPASGVEAEAVAYTDWASLTQAFDAGEVDLIAVEGDVASGLAGAEVVCSFGSADYYVAVAPERVDLLRELEDAQARLVEAEPLWLSELRLAYADGVTQDVTLTEEELAWVEGHDSLTVGYLMGYLPYSDAEGGQAEGIVCDVVEGIVDALHLDGITVSYVGYDSLDEMVAHMLAGHTDICFPVGGGAYFAEENGIYHSEPVVTTIPTLVCRSGQEAQAVQSVAVNENNRMQDYYVRAHLPDVEIVYVRSVEECLQCVIDGSAQATVVNGLRATDILRNERYEGLVAYQLAAMDERSFGVPVGEEGLLHLVNRGISALGSDFGLNAAARYTKGLVTYTFSDYMRDNLWIVAIVVLVAAAVIIALLVLYVLRMRREVRATAEELELAHDELQESSEALFEEMDAAEDSTFAQAALLEDVSRAVGTPAQEIERQVRLARTNAERQDVVAACLSAVEDSSQRLLAVADDVRTISLVESGDVTLEVEELELEEIARELRATALPEASAGTQMLEVTCAGVISGRVVADRSRLLQVLRRLVSCAFASKSGEGTVHVRMSEAAAHDAERMTLEVEVSGDGAGLASLDAEQDTGLGLSVAGAIVDVMGGSLEVERTEDAGETYTLMLALRRVDVPEASSPQMDATIPEV